jgi:cysteinyl-tRNA synthetase
LNFPRALAVTWDLAKSNLPAPTKRATLLYFDRVLGLRFADSKSVELPLSDTILALIQQRESARAVKRWNDADALREQIEASGYEIEDTPQGSRVRQRLRG